MAQRTHGRAGAGGRGGADGPAARGRADAAGGRRAWRTPSLDLLGAAYGRRVLLLVGPGDNGGDALYAGALLARRGVRGRGAGCSPTGRTRPGWPRCAAAGGRVVDASTAAGRPTSSSTASSGSAGGRACGPSAVAALDAVAGVPVVAVDVPSGVDVDTGELDGAARDGRRHRHLRHPQGRATSSTRRRRPCGVGPPGRHRARPARGRRSRRSRPTTSRRCCRGPAPDAHKYTRGVVGVRAGSAAYPGAGAAQRRRRGDRAVRDGPVRRRRRGRRPRSGQAHPEVGRRGPGAGLGGRVRRRRRRGRGARRGPAPTASRWSWTPTRWPHVDGPLGVPAVLTPHAGELAAMLGVERADGRGRARCAHARRAAERYDAVVLLKGRHTLVAAPDGRVRVTTTGVPWLATAGAGDVLGGLIGALLAAGLDAVRRRVGRLLAARRRRDAAPRGGGPIVAGDVAGALPAVVRGCLAVPDACTAATRDGRIGRHEPPPVRAPRSWSTWRRSGTTCGRCASWSATGGSDDDRGQGRRLRPRDASRSAARRPRGRAPTGSASPRSTRRWRLREAGDTGRVLCWLDRPGRGLRRRGRPPTSTSRRTPSPSSTRSAPRRRRPPGPRSSSRSTPGSPAAARPSPTGPTLVAARPRRRGATAAGGSPASGRTSPAATSPTTPPTTPRSGAFRDALAGAEAAGLRPGGAPPRQLRGRAPAARRRASTWCAAASRRTASTPRPASRPDLGLRAGDDRRARRWRWSSDRAPAPASPTATPGSPTQRHDASGWCRSGTATACPRHAGNTRRGAGSPASAARSAAGSAWTSSSSTSTATAAEAGRRGRALRARAPTASRPPQDWAEACGTISYEIVTRIGGRLRPPPRRRRRPRHERRRTQGPRGRGRRGRRRRGRHRRRGRPAPPGHRAPRRGRRDAVRLAALARRSRSSPTTAYPCTSRSTSSTARPAAARGAGAAELTVVFVPRLRAQPRLLALPARGLPRPGPRGLLRPALPRPLRPLARGPRDHRAARPRPQAGPRPRRARRARSCWSATRWAA